MFKSHHGVGLPDFEPSWLAAGHYSKCFGSSRRLSRAISDIKIGKQTDDGHVQIKTILLDEIFGFDPDVRLAPTNTFPSGLLV